MLFSNVHQAKSQLSKLIDEAISGSEVIIAKAGKPVVKLVPYVADKGKRKSGFWKGKAWLVGDFDREDKEIDKLFNG